MITPRPRKVFTIASASARPSRNSTSDAGDGQDDGDDQRPARDRIGHDLLEIAEPHEGVAGHLEVVIDEGDPDREEQREDREREDQEHRRRDQQPFEMAVAPLRPRQRVGARHDRRRPPRPFMLELRCAIRPAAELESNRPAGITGRSDLNRDPSERHGHAELLDRVVGGGAGQLQELLRRTPSANSTPRRSVVVSHSAAAVCSAVIGSAPAHTSVHMRSMLRK